METIAEPGSTKPLIQLLGREDGFTKLLGHRDCLSLCHYTGAKAIISVEPGHRFLSEGTTDWEHLISPGRNIIYPIHKQISRLVINMRKACMKQMAERWRAGTSSDHLTAGQGHVGWCLQPHALATPIQGQPRKGCFTQEAAGATAVWNMGWGESHSLGEAVSAAGGQEKGGQHMDVWCKHCSGLAAPPGMHWNQGQAVKMCDTKFKTQQGCFISSMFVTAQMASLS